MPQTLSSLGLASAALLAATSAFAQAPRETYALSWVRAEGTEECPPARELIAEVERRLGREVFDARASRAYEVEVTRFGKVYRSDVFVRGENGEALGHRTLQSDEPGCRALLDATALAIALSIDPEAASRPPKIMAAPEPAAPPPAPVVVAAPPALPPPSACPVAPACPQPKPMARATPVSFALRGQVALGLVPAPTPGVELRFAAEPWGDFGFALGAAYTAPQNAARELGSLDVGLTRATLLGTYRAASSERFRLTLGSGPALGAFHVAVREPAPVTNPGDFVFAAWALAANMEVFVTNQVFIGLGADGLVPLRRQEFLVFGQEQAVWREPWLGGALSLGVGITFP